jgi:hypothetical protein
MALAHTPPRLLIYTRDAWVPEPLRAAMRAWTPKTGISWAFINLMRDLHRAGVQLPADGVRDVLEALWRSVVIESELALVVMRGDTGAIEDYGVVSNRVVTTAGVNYIAADFNDGASDISSFDYHGLGTGGGAEAVGDTTLTTELTTEYTGNVRATGTASNPSANVYRSVGTNTMDSGTPAVTEHGLFSASSAGTLLDRSLFSAINLVGANGDSLQSTYSRTLTAGS